MSIKFLNAAFEANIPSSADKFVLVALADFANEHGEAYPSLQTLSNKTSLDRKTVIKGLGNLSGIAVIADTGERKGKTKQVAVYRIDLRRLTAIAIDAAEGRTKNAKKAKHTENGTIPKHTENGTINSTENGTLKQYRKRYTEPSVIFNHQNEPPDTPIPPASTQKTKADSEPEAGNEAKASSMSVGEVVDLYHEILPSLPSVLKVTDARRKAISARIHDDLKTPSEWRVFFSRVGKSDFLTGKVDGFRADLEWLCKPANMLKVLEGRYERNQAKPAPPPSKHNGFAQRDYSKGINPDGSF